MPDWGTPSGNLVVHAEDVSWTLEEIVTATTLTADYFLVIVNASGNTTITLPAAASHTNRMYTIKNIHSTGTVTIDANGGETIDGEQTIDLKLQYQYVTIVCDGDEWLITGGEYVKMEDLLDRLLNEQVDLLNELIVTGNQCMLHLASETHENITKKDGEDIREK